MNLVSPFREAVAAHFANKFGQPDPAAWKPGDDLHAATARRWGIPVTARRVSPLDAPHPFNRAARRAAGNRDPLTSAQIAAHPQPTYTKGADK